MKEYGAFNKKIKEEKGKREEKYFENKAEKILGD